MKVIETLTAELERLYDLDELKKVSADLLGVAPDAIGGDMALASFARALAEHCVRVDDLDALIDVMELSRRDLSDEIRQFRHGTPVSQLEPGDTIDGWIITRAFGAGPCSTAYEAHRGEQAARLRVLHREIVAQRRGVGRYFALTRALDGMALPAIPRVLQDGAAERVRYIAHELDAGASLSSLELGTQHLFELLPMLWGVTEGLASLHQAGHCHGALHAGNVLVQKGPENTPKVVLLDPGAHLLRPTLDLAGHRPEHAWLYACSPEQLAGGPATSRSDVYALGVLLYTLLAGKPPFEGKAADLLVGHLSWEPEGLSMIASGRGATAEVDALVAALLNKNPEERPADGVEVLEMLRRIWRASTRPPSWVGAERLVDRLHELAAKPWDEELAGTLEASVDLGADALQLAEGFASIGRQLETHHEPRYQRAVRQLKARAARLYEAAGAQQPAERLYEDLLMRDALDVEAARALEALWRKSKKFDELIELYLERVDVAEDARGRAELLAKIGDIYAKDLGDAEQAVVAYSQAVCEDPANESHAEAVERVAGSRGAAWEEVLTRCMEAASDRGSEGRVWLLTHVGRWYADKVARPDHAAACFAEALEQEPAHEPALRELARVYRKAQQWSELGQVLLRWADVAAPGVARDLRSEAAGLLSSHLGNPASAKQLYQTVLAEDPGHEPASAGLVTLLSAEGDRAGVLTVLEARATTLAGEDRHQLLCDIAEAAETQLSDLGRAERHLRQVLADSPEHLTALRGLDRILARLERYDELLDNLKRQLDLGATNRQKIALLERIAGLYDEQFLDHAHAAEALERVLELEPSRAATADELARHYRSLERWNELAQLLARQFKIAEDDTRKAEVGVRLARVFEEQLTSPPHAIRAYEAVVEVAPSHSAALEGLARLRSASGDAENALLAIEALAEKADTTDRKIEQYVRAARLLHEQGDDEGAILRLKRALDLRPTDPELLRQLRRGYTKLGNHGAAADLLEEQIGSTSGTRARAELNGELALVCWRDLDDLDRASAAAKLALHLDPTNREALLVMGHLAYSDGAYVEAARRLQPVVADVQGELAARTLLAYVDSLARTGHGEQALRVARAKLELLADQPAPMLRLTEIAAEHGTPQSVIHLCQTLLERFDYELQPTDEATVRVRLSRAMLKLNQSEQAFDTLGQGFRVAPDHPELLTALAECYEAAGNYRAQIDTLQRKLESLQGDERVELLLHMSQVASKQNDADYAARSLLVALSERPNDRNILAKLVELYSAGRDWPRLLQVIARLAGVVDDPAHRAKYLYTGALIAVRELGDRGQALELLDRALESDPSFVPALDQALELRRDLGDHEGLKRMLKLRAELQSREEDRGPLLQTLQELATVYAQHLGRIEQAIAVCESALAVAPDDAQWQQRLAQLYARDPLPHYEKALQVLGECIRREPRRPLAYQLLRKVHTGARRADGAWLACQALTAIGRADIEERRFFDRFRSQEPPEIFRPVGYKEWLELVMPSQGDLQLTALFALLQPCVVAERHKYLDEFGLTEGHALTVEAYPYGLVLAVHRAAEALRMTPPPCFQDPERAGIIGFLATEPPGVLFASGAFDDSLSASAAAFVAGRHISHYLPGLYMRQLLSTKGELKAHLFAALRLVKPNFPIANELRHAVEQASAALSKLADHNRNQLARVVTRLLDSGASLDLKRWARAVDLAADRTGLLFCDDLPTAAGVIQSSKAKAGTPTPPERLDSLLAYSVSGEYMRLRSALGLAIDG